MAKPVGKPFQKGQSGNPGGRPKVKGALAEIEDFNSAELRKIVSKNFRLTKPEVKAAGESDTLPCIEVAIARAIHKGIVTGEVSRIMPLIERTCGKVKEEADVNMVVSAVKQELSLKSSEELLALVKGKE
jgi:hypothetical protein